MAYYNVRVRGYNGYSNKDESDCVLVKADSKEEAIAIAKRYNFEDCYSPDAYEVSETTKEYFGERKPYCLRDAYPEIKLELDDLLLELFKEEIMGNMVECPAGSFIMGSPINETGRKEDEIQHKVTISKAFKISKYLITKKQFYSIIGKSEQYSKDDEIINCLALIDWYEAKLFCNRLNYLFKDYIPQDYKFALPTEAQWEYACRAETVSPLNNDKSQPVDSKKPNAWGIYDMQNSNVSEWCEDFYEDYPMYEVTDPIGYNGDTGYAFISSWPYNTNRHRNLEHIVRGGSRPACRESYIPIFSNHGFRLALVPILKEIERLIVETNN